MAPEQLALRYGGDTWPDAAWREFLGELRESFTEIGIKKAASDLDIGHSEISHALAEGHRHPVKAKWIPYVAIAEPKPRVVGYLAGLAGYDLVPQKQLEPGEKLAALTGALEKCLGPELRAAIWAEARRMASRGDR